MDANHYDVFILAALLNEIFEKSPSANALHVDYARAVFDEVASPYLIGRMKRP